MLSIDVADGDQSARSDALLFLFPALATEGARGLVHNPGALVPVLLRARLYVVSVPPRNRYSTSGDVPA